MLYLHSNLELNTELVLKLCRTSIFKMDMTTIFFLLISFSGQIEHRKSMVLSYCVSFIDAYTLFSEKYLEKTVPRVFKDTLNAYLTIHLPHTSTCPITPLVSSFALAIFSSQKRFFIITSCSLSLRSFHFHS